MIYAVNAKRSVERREIEKCWAEKSAVSMVEEAVRTEERLKSPESSQPPSYLEVLCRTSGKVRRFAAGTTAGFAIHVINCKLEHGDAPTLHIESVKEEEEPVTFGPNAILVNYGNGWNLQTVTIDDDRAKKLKQTSELFPEIAKTPNFQSFNRPKNMNQPSSGISPLYIVKILLVFAFMFLLGGILTLILENLPAANLSGFSSE